MKISSLNNIQNIKYNRVLNPSLRNNYIKNDTVSFSANPDIKYYDCDNDLFDGCEEKPMKKFEDMNPDNIALVHMTNYAPRDGEIVSTKNATKDENGAGKYRSTVHFALNHVVHEHMYGEGWHQMKYGIILPFNKTTDGVQNEDILGGKWDDFYLRGNIKIPEGSYIVKYNPDIQKGKLRVSDLSTSDEFKNTEGVKLVESSNPNLNETVNTVIRKAGYSNLDDIMSKGMGIDSKYAHIMLDAKKQLELFDEDADLFAKISSTLNHQRILDYNKRIAKSWANFCEKYNYTNRTHATSPWGRSEALIECIKLVGLYDDSWIYKWKTESYEPEDENCFTLDDDKLSELIGLINSQNEEDEDLAAEIDYQKEFLTVIDEIKKQTPSDKPLSYDIDKMREIIETSPRPSVALDRIEKELKLKVMIDESDCDNDLKQEDIYKMVDLLLCVSNAQKMALE